MLLQKPVLLLFIMLLPVIAFAQGNHWHGGGHCHVHSSGHGHSAAHHTPQLHYYYHNYGRSGYGAGRSDVGYLPLKGVQEISLGAGAVTSWQAFDTTINFATPGYVLSYRYYITGGLALGFSLATQGLQGKDFCNCGQPNGLVMPYNFTLNTLTLALDVRWLFMSTDNAQLYGGAAAGIARVTEKDAYQDGTASSLTNYKFTGQLTLIGLRYGKALGVYAELGLGYKGLLCGGISYEINYRKTHTH